MRKIFILLLFASVSAYGQLDTIDLRVSYFGVPSIAGQADFVFNEAYKINQSLRSVDSLNNVIDVTDSTAVFTTINVDSAVVTNLNYSPPHASLSFADSSEVIACTEDLWSKVTGNAGALFRVIDADNITAARDSITITVPGDYMLVWNMSFRGTASDIWYARIRKNNVASAFQMQRRTANADTGNMGLNAYFDHMHAGDDLSFYIMNTADSDDMTLQASQVIIWMLHPR